MRNLSHQEITTPSSSVPSGHRGGQPVNATLAGRHATTHSSVELGGEYARLVPARSVPAAEEN